MRNDHNENLRCACSLTTAWALEVGKSAAVAMLSLKVYQLHQK